ncbi:hypothetical protein CVT26_007346 [Gymnopilus dilepis]|uniref:RING-type domain-containing protein n=1 Tax=Gymnopilus dilepis TaxID=231916 RepID=A0A409VP65_9AGAR|nr:hypothetical protein CVT26_007346 [Gymnopilus dilepis]
MLSCRICLEEIKKPASLPCGIPDFSNTHHQVSDCFQGHIFCSECIVQTVKAVKPYTHMQPCPICRSLYNVAPINLNVVPPNLRQFITPSVRRLYIDETPVEEASETNGANGRPEPPSPTSELSRLRAENIALRNNCAMWRKRAEAHGAANLNLLNFVRAIRDQAATLARERQQLEQHCRVLKRKLEDDQISRSERALEELVKINPAPQGPEMPDLLADSLLFAPPPFQEFSQFIGPSPDKTPTPRKPASPQEISCLPLGDPDPTRPIKRMKIDHLLTATS